MGTRRRVMLRVRPPVPFGEVTLVPTAMTGRPEAVMGRAMAADLIDTESLIAMPGSPRPALWAPLSARLAALGGIMERRRRST